MWYIYTMEHYSVFNKDKLMSFAPAWMEVGRTIFSEISQEEKEKYLYL